MSAIRQERTFETFSRGAELVRTIQAFWDKSNRLPAGSNRLIAEGSKELCEEFDLTIPEWHYWCDIASPRGRQVAEFIW